MKIGIIGIGTLTLELTRRAAQAGYQVIVHNPRGNSLVRESVRQVGNTIEMGSIQKAASADLVILFLPKSDMKEVIGSLPDMTGKIVVHTSGLIFNPETSLAGLHYAMTYKITAALLPTAHVVKLLKPIKLDSSTSDTAAEKLEIYYIADHPDSKNTIKIFLEELNFSPIDLSDRSQLQNSDAPDNKNSKLEN